MKAIREPIQVAGPLWLVPGENQGRFPRAHSFLIKDRQTVLIDTGAGPSALLPLAHSRAVDLVLISHAHPDHMAGNHFFADRDIWVPAAAGDSAESLAKLSQRLLGSSGLTGPWCRFMRQEMDYKDQPPTGFFQPHQEIKIGRTRLKVIPTPGHSLDHCCFYLPDWGVLLSADVDLTPFGPWYGYEECDLAQLRASIESLKALQPRLVAPSHRLPVTENIPQAFDNFARVLDRREAALLDFLARQRSMAAILESRLIYGHAPKGPAFMDYWEGQMIKKHLDELLAKGVVKPSGDGFVAA